MKNKTILFLLGTFLISSMAFADELFLTLEQATMQGYRPYQSTVLATAIFVLNDSALQEPPLAWPFEALYKKAHMGNNFVQFQPYGQPGYHMGADMLLESASWALAPVAGRVEAGHYAYTDLPNGNRIKQWIPWPGRGDDNYFEVAVTAANGFRYELHHVDRRSLPAAVIEALRNNGSVAAGQRLGQVVPWPTSFHYVHVHLNVFNAMGTALNPESLFEILPDTKAPSVQFLALYQDGSSEWLKEGVHLIKPVKSFIVTGADEKDLNQYVQAIPLIEFSQGGVAKKSIDFRNTLLDSSGIFTDIRDIYPFSLRLSDKSVLRQPADFYPVMGTKFHQQLLVNQAPTGEPFQLKVEDMAGNAVKISGIF